MPAPQPYYNKVPLGKLLDQAIYANTKMIGLDKNFSKPIYNFNKGDYIGGLYSWVNRCNKTYMMFYRTGEDFRKFNPFYVELPSSSTALQIPEIDSIKAEIEKEQIEQKGIIRSYLDKYLPIIVLAIVAYFLVPTLLNEARKNRTMGKLNITNYIIICGAILLFTTAKRQPTKKIKLPAKITGMTQYIC